MNCDVTTAAERVMRYKAVYDWVATFIRQGGYTHPLDLFESYPDGLPPKYSRYFDDPINGFGVLYSQAGAMALMDQILKPFHHQDKL